MIFDEIPSTAWLGILGSFYLLSQRAEIRQKIRDMVGEKDAAKFEYILLKMIRGFKPERDKEDV
jgi:hypothetical protein